MSSVYADLVVPDLSIDDLLQHRTLDWARQQLERLRDEPDLGPAWREAQLLGLDRSAGPDQIPRRACGVSWHLAPVAGLGFARDDYLETVPPRGRAGADPSTPGPVDAAWSVRYRRRAGEIAAVRHAAHTTVGTGELALAAAVDLHATACFDFPQGYRRRLAHVLAYEASLRAGSHKPYQRHFPALIGGTVHQLRSSLERLPLADTFSVLINLTATLREAATYENLTGTAHPDLGARVSAAAAKTSLLTGQLATATDHRRLTLHRDARDALTALRVELDRTGDITYTGCTIFPAWGLLADADSYA